MLAYLRIKEKLTPIHGRYIGDVMQLTIKLKKDAEGVMVPDFIRPLHSSEHDDSFEDTKKKIEELRAKYKITKIELI